MFGKPSGGSGKHWAAPIAYALGVMALASGLACPFVAYIMRASIAAKGDKIIDWLLVALFVTIIAGTIAIVAGSFAVMARSRATVEVARLDVARPAAMPPMMYAPPVEVSRPALPPPSEPRHLGSNTPWTVREVGAIVKR